MEGPGLDDKNKSKVIQTNAPGKSIFAGRKPLAPVVSLPQLPKKGLTLEEKVEYLERMLLMQSKQITRILEVLTE